MHFRRKKELIDLMADFTSRNSTFRRIKACFDIYLGISQFMHCDLFEPKV
jgi:hypothetical protein